MGHRRCFGPTWFTGRSPSFSGRRQLSRDGTSRMMREYQVRICERLGVKFPGPTGHTRKVSWRAHEGTSTSESCREEVLRSWVGTVEHGNVRFGEKRTCGLVMSASLRSGVNLSSAALSQACAGNHCDQAKHVLIELVRLREIGEPGFGGLACHQLPAQRRGHTPR